MILTLNPGSSSLKFAWFAPSGAEQGRATTLPVDWRREDAAAAALDAVLNGAATRRATQLLHRVVHGGHRFRAVTPVTPAVRTQIADLAALAPLHNPISLALLAACEHRLAGVPQYAVFDTAFHQNLPEAAATYALPPALARQHGIRRYGFHGISHAAVARRTAEALERPIADLNVISLHLGHGASACAIAGGRSVDTSMGMTPTEGLVMGSRCGDLDPGAIVHLLRAADLDAQQLDDLVNRDSGLRGLCGHAEMRQVREAAEQGDTAAQLARAVYVHRLRRYLGAFYAVLGRVDVLVFTGGVGENDAALREQTCAALDALGIFLDSDRNCAPLEPLDEVARISAPSSAVAVLVMRADEEREMVRQLRALLEDSGATK